MTHLEIAARLELLALEMLEVGTAMDYFGGFRGDMAARGRELCGASRIAKDWAAAIREEQQ